MPGLLVLLITFALMWAFFILPQQRRVKQHQALVLSLEPGQEVVTAGGVVGTIVGVVDDIVILRIADGVEVRVLRGAITRRTDPEPPPGSVDDHHTLDITEAHGGDELDQLDEPNPSAGPGDDGEAWPLAEHDDDIGRERG